MGLKITPEQYDRLYTAVAYVDSESLERVSISPEEKVALMTALSDAMGGNPTAFEENPEQVAQAYRLLGIRFSSTSQPGIDELRDALRPMVKQSEYWQRHVVGRFGTPEVFTGRSPKPATPVELTPADVNFDAGFEVISGASKFVIPVGELPGAVPLVYPEGHEKAGNPIVNWEGKPIGEAGVVFFNHTDGTYQAAASGHDHVIIFNQVTPEQAEQLYKKIAEFASDPRQLTHGQLIQVLNFAESLGLGDRYNSDTGFIRKNMLKAREMDGRGSVEAAYGFMNRNRDVVRAVYIPEPFTFGGENVQGQQMPNGGFVVRVGGKTQAVQPKVFLETYKHPDGGKIELGGARHLTIGGKFSPPKGQYYKMVLEGGSVEVMLLPNVGDGVINIAVSRFEEHVTREPYESPLGGLGIRRESVNVVRRRRYSQPFEAPVITVGGERVVLVENKAQAEEHYVWEYWWSGTVPYNPNQATPVVIRQPATADVAPTRHDGAPFIERGPEVVREARTMAEFELQAVFDRYRLAGSDSFAHQFKEAVRKYLAEVLKRQPTDVEMVDFLRATGEKSLSYALGARPADAVTEVVERALKSRAFSGGRLGEKAVDGREGREGPKVGGRLIGK